MAGTSIADEPSPRAAAATRKEWLIALVKSMVPWFEALGYPLPPLRISEGFPRTGERGRDVTEVWSDDDGGSYTIVVRPDLMVPDRLAAALAFRMAQVAAGPTKKNPQLFRHIAISIGLSGRRAEAAPKALFRELVRPILEAAGPLPLVVADLPGVKPKSKQSARLLKVTCPHCGYVARVARKWLDDVGPPHCPSHGAMLRDD